jgi:hypothetical protein
MKFRTTAKAIRNSGSNVVCAGYCDLQNLLRHHNPIAYTCGVYGWNFDVYEVYGLTICTGYRGMVGRRANNISEYEKKAEKILDWNNKSMTYEEKEEAVEKLLEEFCKQA